MYIYRVLPTGRDGGESPPTSLKFAHSLPPGKILPPVDSPFHQTLIVLSL